MEEYLTPQEAELAYGFLDSYGYELNVYCRSDDGSDEKWECCQSLMHKLCYIRKNRANALLAEAQIIGFVHGRDGYSLTSLVEGMGLKRREWEAIKAGYPIRCYLDDNAIGEIEQTVKAA